MGSINSFSATRLSWHYSCNWRACYRVAIKLGATDVHFQSNVWTAKKLRDEPKLLDTEKTKAAKKFRKTFSFLAELHRFPCAVRLSHTPHVSGTDRLFRPLATAERCILGRDWLLLCNISRTRSAFTAPPQPCDRIESCALSETVLTSAPPETAPFRQGRESYCAKKQ